MDFRARVPFSEAPAAEYGTARVFHPRLTNILTLSASVCKGQIARGFEYGTDSLKFGSPESRGSLSTGPCIRLNRHCGLERNRLPEVHARVEGR